MDDEFLCKNLDSASLSREVLSCLRLARTHTGYFGSEPRPTEQLGNDSNFTDRVYFFFSSYDGSDMIKAEESFDTRHRFGTEERVKKKKETRANDKHPPTHTHTRTAARVRPSHMQKTHARNVAMDCASL